MPKTSNIYICDNCGKEYLGWQGRCDYCGEWNTIVESKVAVEESRAIASGLGMGKGNLSGDLPKVQTQSLRQISKQTLQRIPTNISELDRVFGEGGIVPGSVSLLTGEPGVGKSTILMQTAISLAGLGQKVLYISAEENLHQIADRAERIISSMPAKAVQRKPIDENLKLVNAYYLEQILELLVTGSRGKKKEENLEADFIILDSIQTITSNQVRGIPGGLAQIKYCSASLISACKQLGKTLLLVGHINKEGEVAGPKVLEHLVDVVLFFSGERKSDLRVLRALKNRFGSVDEVGIFLMQESGLKAISNPGEYFLFGENGDIADSKGQVGSCRTLIFEGLRPIVVEVQALAVPTDFAYPKRVSEGISMARLQLICAVLAKYLKLKLHNYDIYLKIAQGFRVEDRGVDLAVALAIISSIKSKPIAKTTIAFGEINLSGQIGQSLQQSRREKEVKTLGYRNIVTSSTVRHITGVSL